MNIVFRNFFFIARIREPVIDGQKVLCRKSNPQLIGVSDGCGKERSGAKYGPSASLQGEATDPGGLILKYKFVDASQFAGLRSSVQSQGQHVLLVFVEG